MSVPKIEEILLDQNKLSYLWTGDSKPYAENHTRKSKAGIFEILAEQTRVMPEHECNNTIPVGLYGFLSACDTALVRSTKSHSAVTSLAYSSVKTRLPRHGCDSRRVFSIQTVRIVSIKDSVNREHRLNKANSLHRCKTSTHALCNRIYIGFSARNRHIGLFTSCLTTRILADDLCRRRTGMRKFLQHIERLE